MHYGFYVYIYIYTISRVKASFKGGQTSGGMWLLGGGFHNPQGLSNSHLVPPLISITCVHNRFFNQFYNVELCFLF